MEFSATYRSLENEFKWDASANFTTIRNRVEDVGNRGEGIDYIQTGATDAEPSRTGEGFRSANNYRFIRYADVLLMYAETLNNLGRTADAYQYVSRVRQRAGLAPLSVAKPGLTQAQFQTQMEHERVTELAGEGHRWNDLARWGYFESQAKVDVLKQRDPAFSTFAVGTHHLLPLPQRDVDINPNLTQNDGY
ncbi:hypothetical protein BH24BAC1_BH24BAC1_29560 [soil metagenome]